MAHSQPTKDRCNKLICSYMRQAEKLVQGKLIPKEIHSVCFDFYFEDIIIDSKILTDDEKLILRQLFVDNGYIMNPEWKLLYRATDEDFSCSQWDKKCIDKSNVISIISSDNGCVFGGFTMTGWKYRGSTDYGSDRNAFLYQLRSSIGHKPKIYLVSRNSYSNAAHYAGGYMSCFGTDGCDLAITSDCNNSSDSWVGWAAVEGDFILPTPHHINDTKENFKVLELETFMTDSCVLKI